MFNNSWFKKEKPLPTMIGLGGGATSLQQNSGSVGKFTIAPSPSPGSTTEYAITDGYSSPVSNGNGSGHLLEMVVTSGPFVATIKMWGAGGGDGINGGTAGSGGYVTGEFEFIKDEKYFWDVGEGGRRGNDGAGAIGGGGEGRGSPGPQGAGGGGGGYTALFKAPAGSSHPQSRTLAYCVLCAGGGGGSGQGGNTADYHESYRGGSGGGVYPPAAAPFATNFGGGRGTNPTTGAVVGQYAAGPGNQGGGAPLSFEGSPTNDGNPAGGWGGERQAGDGGFGSAFQGGTSTGGGGGGGGGGYYGGGSGANPTGKLYGGGGGGGGFATVAPVHPEGIACTNVTGMNSRQNGDPAPYTVVANSSDPDWGGAGQGAQYKYPEGWSDANAAGASGRIVIKAPA